MVGIVSGNYNLFRTNVNFPAFYLRREGVAISPDLKVVTKDSMSLIVTGKQIGRASCRERVYVLV